MKDLIEKLIKESSDNLRFLQAQRGKANKKRKEYWQKRVDNHFGLK